jgi:hypothetical protein
MPASKEPCSIAVVCEADADRQTGCDLADRVIADALIMPIGELGTVRQYRGHSAHETHLSWVGLNALQRKRPLKIHRGHFLSGGSWGAGPPEAYQTRLALLHLRGADVPPAAVMLLHDSDGDDGWRKGMELARSEPHYAFEIVIGVPHGEREAWVLAGFVPGNAAEEEALIALQRRLGFHPCRHPERLNPGRDHLEKGTKRALRDLIADDRDRERQCWTETALDVLQECGRLTGLPEFLHEVETRLLKLLA